MNHIELRRECEPSLYDLIEERAQAEMKQAPAENNFSIDFDLIGRVLSNERKRELQRAQKCAEKMRLGAREKRSNL